MKASLKVIAEISKEICNLPCKTKEEWTFKAQMVGDFATLCKHNKVQRNRYTKQWEYKK